MFLKNCDNVILKLTVEHSKSGEFRFQVPLLGKLRYFYVRFNGLKFKYIYFFCDQNRIFSIIRPTPVFNVTLFFRNHSNMLICCLIIFNCYLFSVINNGSYY